MSNIRKFGTIKGSALIPLLTTLLQEGSLEQVNTLHILTAKKTDSPHQAEIQVLQERMLKAGLFDFKLQIGKMLVKKGKLERATYHEVKESQTNSPGSSFGQHLIENTHITQDDIKDLIQEVALLVFYEILMWDQLELSLESRPIEQIEDVIGIDLNIFTFSPLEKVLLEAEKNYPVLELMHDKMSDPHAIVSLSSSQSQKALSKEQAHCIELINNKNTLRDILFLSHLRLFDTYATLFQLLGQGMIQLGKAAPAQFVKKTRELPPLKTTNSTSTPSPQPPKSPMSTPKVSREFLKRTYGSDLQQILTSLLKSGRKTGKLIIDNQKNIARSEVTLNQGDIVHASSSLMTYRFGDLLVMKQLISPEQLMTALRAQKESPGKRLGELLVEQGAIEGSTIPTIIFEQIEFVIYEILSWDDAKFYFQPIQEAPQNEYVVYAELSASDDESHSPSKKGRDLLTEAEKNLSLMGMMKSSMPHPKTILDRTSDDIKDTPLSSGQIQILELVNGSHSLQDILIISPQGYFETYTALFQLFRAHLISAHTTEKSHNTGSSSANAAAKTPTSEPAPPLKETPQGKNTAEHPLEDILGLDLVHDLSRLPAAQHPHLRALLKSVLKMLN